MRIVELAGIGPTPFAGMMLSDMGAEVIRVDRVGEIIAARTQDEWVEVFEGTDACVTPVLTMGQTPGHPHALARDSFFRFNGVVQPRPAPRFGGTPTRPASDSRPPGADTGWLLGELGYSSEEIAALCAAGAAE